MIHNAAKILVSVFIALHLVSCVAPVDTRSTMMNAIDQTKGSYTKFQNNKLVLLTMENASHAALSQGKLINNDDALPARYEEFLDNLANKYGLQRVADWPLRSLKIRCFVFKPDTELAKNTLTQIALEEHVESVEELQIYQAMASGYNDPLVELQEGFSEMGIEKTHSLATGKGVKIAVIDTGVDIKHTDLKKRIPFTKNFVDKSNTKFENDIHGTAISGVIASNAGNAEGMVGIAPDADIYALKACWHDSQSYRDAYCNTFTLAKAIDMAILKQVDIINLSLAGPEDILLERLVTNAIEKNIIVVGAVHPNLERSFPTSVTGVIAASEKPVKLGTENSSNSEIFAQGNKVISTTPDNKYDFYSGSSISTAHVTGIIALIRQRKPHLSYENIHKLLVEHQTGNDAIDTCKVFATLIGADDCN